MRQRSSPRWPVFVLLTLGFVTLTAWATLTPPIAMPDAPGSDKFWHVLAFGVMILPTALFSPRHLPAVALGLALYGVAIEVIQPYVGRHAEFGDALADLCGLGLGAGLGLGLRRLIWR